MTGPHKGAAGINTAIIYCNFPCLRSINCICLSIYAAAASSARPPRSACKRRRRRTPVSPPVNVSYLGECRTSLGLFISQFASSARGALSCSRKRLYNRVSACQKLRSHDRGSRGATQSPSHDLCACVTGGGGGAGHHQ